MQTPKMQFGIQSLLEKTQAHIFVSQGNLQHLKKGDSLQVTIGNIIQGKTQLHIDGQEVKIEGLNKNLQGKIITLKVVKAGEHPQLELQQQVQQGEAKKTSQTTLTQTKSLNHKTQQEEAKKTSQTILTETKSLNHKTHMQVFSVTVKAPIPALLNHSKELPKHAIFAVASKQQGQLITLGVTQSPVSNITALSLAVAGQQIQVESRTRPIHVGEIFKVQFNQQELKSATLSLQPYKPSAIGSAVFTLPVGKIITAYVEQRMSSGNISLQWQQQTFESPAPRHVQVGDALQLQVIKAGNKPTFNVLNHIPQVKGKAANIVRQHIGKTTPQYKNLNSIIQSAAKMQLKGPAKLAASPQLSSSLSLLSNWINEHGVSSDKPLDGQRLAGLVRQLGQGFESSLMQAANGDPKHIQYIKMHDLKAILLQLANANNAPGSPHEVQHIKKAAEQGVTRLESQQGLNLMAMFQADPIRFELPMMIQGQLINTYLSIQAEQSAFGDGEHHDSNESVAYNILFALDLSGLGSLRVDARIDQHTVYARFYHSNDDSRHFVQQNMHLLQEKLQQAGYDDIYLNVMPEKQMSNDKQAAFTQLINHTPNRDGLLDIEV